MNEERADYFAPRMIGDAPPDTAEVLWYQGFAEWVATWWEVGEMLVQDNPQDVPYTRHYFVNEKDWIEWHAGLRPEDDEARALWARAVGQEGTPATAVILWNTKTGKLHVANRGEAMRLLQYARAQA